MQMARSRSAPEMAYYLPKFVFNEYLRKAKRSVIFSRKFVLIEGGRSQSHELKCGVPQGSVL